MPKRDDDYMAGKRENILDAALTCLTRTGLAGLSTTAICAEAGISMGQLYTHFATKDDIILGLAERSIQGRQRRFRAQSGAELRRQLLGLVVHAYAQRERMRIDLDLIAAAASNARLAQHLRRAAEHQELIETLRRLETKGELRTAASAEALAMALDAMHIGLGILALMGHEQDAKLFRAAMAAVIDALVVRAE